MLYGRDAERALIGALLDAARASRSGALVLRGEPGAGKTALLEDARERAVGMQVLWARGVESESELPFAALQQLLRPALGGLDGLPAPQAAALRSAFGLEEGAGLERFLVYTACLTLLVRAGGAATGPVRRRRRPLARRRVVGRAAVRGAAARRGGHRAAVRRP